MSALDTILGKLRAAGLSVAQAAGVAGNLQTESGLNPAAYNPAEGAIGLAQWEGGRRTALQSFARSRGTAETDLNTQVDFMVSEFHGSESRAYAKLLAANDPGSAAAVFDQYYERSSGAARAQRVANAEAIAAGAGGGTSSSWSAQNTAAVSGDGWTSDLARIALQVGGGILAGCLVIVGLKETVKG